jgi:ABC-type polysaccharide/polyol phosphate export permease
MNMLYDKSVIIQKVVFPRFLLILSVGWQHSIILFTYFIIFLCAGKFLGLRLLPGVLYIPVIFIQATLIGLAIGMILSSFALRYRDIQHLWGVLLQIFFWLTPIVYPYKPEETLTHYFIGVLAGKEIVTPWNILDIFIRLQPMSVLMHDARRALLYSDTLGMPSAGHTIGVTTIWIVFFLLAALVFKHRSRYFIQEY